MLTLAQLRQRLPSAACLAALLLLPADSASALGVQDRGQRDRGQQRERPAQGGGKDRPAQGGARDKPARGGAQDRPAKGEARDKPAGERPKQDRPAKRDQVRDKPAPQGQRDRTQGAEHDTPPAAERGRQRAGEHDTPRPRGAEHDTPPGAERGRDQARDRVTDHVTDRPGAERATGGGADRGAAGRAVADAARTQQIHGLERSHRRRVARMERLRDVYREQGDTNKIAELEGLLARQQKLYKGKLAVHEKDLGTEQLQRVLRDLPTRDHARGQGQRTDRAGRGATDKPADKVTDRPSDKPTDRPVDRPVDKPVDKPGDKPGDRQRSAEGDQ